jgi:type II secretory pathway pseudopilin PulG
LFPKAAEKKNNMKRGFTLVEIMIVVGILIVLVLIAVPVILRSRIVANEGAALANLRSINNACQLYQINKETYPPGLQEMSSPAVDPPYIDTALAAGRKQGYEFIYKLLDSDSFTVNANPTASGMLKGRYFFMNEIGVIHANPSLAAGPDDQIVQ